jgi:hypothetical protein
VNDDAGDALNKAGIAAAGRGRRAAKAGTALYHAGLSLSFYPYKGI